MSSKDNKEKIPVLLTNQQREHFFHPSVRRSKTVLDYILNSTLWIPEPLDSEFFVTGTWIPDSGFRIPDSTSRNFPDSGICITLHEAISSKAEQSARCTVPIQIYKRIFYLRNRVVNPP